MAGNVFFLLAVVSPPLAKAVMWGWGIELIYMGCLIGRAALSKTFNNGRSV